MAFSKRAIVITACVLLAAGYGGYRLMFGGVGGMGPGGMMDMGGAMPVSTAQALEKPVTLWDEFSGRVRAVEDVQIRPRVSGTLESVHFKEGDVIAKGTRLFTIDLEPYTAEFKRAEALLDAAKANVELTSVELERAKKLYAEKAIATREYDAAVNAAKAAQAVVKGAEATLDLARLNMQYAEVKAPITGTIGRPEITVGNVVNDGPGAPVLATMQSLDPVYVDFEIDEQAFLRYLGHSNSNRSSGKKLDIPVYIALANEQEFTRRGKIQSFDNQLDSTSGTLRVRAVFENKERTLLPGLFAKVRLGSAAEENVVLVNDKAIGTDQSKKFVFVVKDDGSADYREVKLGPLVDGLRVVRDGLKAGENIIVNGLMRVRPGSKVMPQPVDMLSLQPANAAEQKEQKEAPKEQQKQEQKEEPAVSSEKTEEKPSPAEASSTDADASKAAER